MILIVVYSMKYLPLCAILVCIILFFIFVYFYPVYIDLKYFDAVICCSDKLHLAIFLNTNCNIKLDEIVFFDSPECKANINLYGCRFIIFEDVYSTTVHTLVSDTNLYIKSVNRMKMSLITICTFVTCIFLTCKHLWGQHLTNETS